jgi:acyl-coenzyme A synthetase/AMP-(fatty) acid ligase
MATDDANETLCVVFTSGSTGSTQHVLLSYTSWMHRFRWQQSHYPLQPCHSLLVKTSPAFVDSVWETLMCAMCGALTPMHCVHVTGAPMYSTLSKNLVTRVTSCATHTNTSTIRSSISLPHRYLRKTCMHAPLSPVLSHARLTVVQKKRSCSACKV